MCKKCASALGQRFVGYTPRGVDLRDIGEVRKLLGTLGEGRSDDEIAYIRDIICGFAEDAFDHWWRARAAQLAESPTRFNNSGEGASAPSSP